MATVDLDGLPVVVTGSTRGLGRAFATALARTGARVVVNGTTESSVAPVVEELRSAGAEVVGLAGSVADHDIAHALVECCVDTFGTIGMLVNNAGFTRDRSMARMTPQEFDDVVAVHLRGTFSCSQAAITPMKAAGAGRIVNVTSGAGLFGMFGQANYSAAKAGVVGLTRVMDLELYRAGIRVNALAPVAATDMTAVFSGGDVAHAVEFPAPERVAPVVTFLASPAADEVHGQVISFDGEELSIWSHPRATSTWRQDGWDVSAMTVLGDPAVQERRQPDRWGAGVLPS